MKSIVIQNLTDACAGVLQISWDRWWNYVIHAEGYQNVIPLASDSNDKKVHDMIVTLFAATGIPPKASDVVRALAIPEVSKTIVYTAIESLRRKGFLARKEIVEEFADWGKQSILVPLRHSNGQIYNYRDWPVARKSAKRTKPRKKSLQQKLL